MPAVRKGKNGDNVRGSAINTAPGGKNGKEDYHRALDRSLLFLHAQRSGVLPISNPISWRTSAGLRKAIKTVVYSILYVSMSVYEAYHIMNINYLWQNQPHWVRNSTYSVCIYIVNKWQNNWRRFTRRVFWRGWNDEIHICHCTFNDNIGLVNYWVSRFIWSLYWRKAMLAWTTFHVWIWIT